MFWSDLRSEGLIENDAAVPPTGMSRRAALRRTRVPRWQSSKPTASRSGTAPRSCGTALWRSSELQIGALRRTCCAAAGSCSTSASPRSKIPTIAGRFAHCRTTLRCWRPPLSPIRAGARELRQTPRPHRSPKNSAAHASQHARRSRAATPARQSAARSIRGGRKYARRASYHSCDERTRPPSGIRPASAV